MHERPIVLAPELHESQRSFELTGTEFHHICRVLRLRTGDELEFRDGRGLVAQARLEGVERRRARAAILSRERPEPPAGPALQLALPLLKGRRLDWILEKGTELGVAAFHLFLSRHGVVRRERAPERYAELIASAYCQCRRLILPELTGPRPFDELLAVARDEDWAMAWGDEQLAGSGGGAADWTMEQGRTHLAWVGPEGGFDDSEREALREAGALALNLGPLRLRSETAALALACRFPSMAGR